MSPCGPPFGVPFRNPFGAPLWCAIWCRLVAGIGDMLHVSGIGDMLHATCACTHAGMCAWVACLVAFETTGRLLTAPVAAQAGSPRTQTHQNRTLSGVPPDGPHKSQFKENKAPPQIEKRKIETTPFSCWGKSYAIPTYLPPRSPPTCSPTRVAQPPAYLPAPYLPIAYGSAQQTPLCPERATKWRPMFELPRPFAFWVRGLSTPPHRPPTRAGPQPSGSLAP